MFVFLLFLQIYLSTKCPKNIYAIALPLYFFSPLVEPFSLRRIVIGTAVEMARPIPTTLTMLDCRKKNI